MKSHAANEELFTKAMEIIGPELDTYRSDRETNVEESYKVADAMFRAMTNRDLDTQERAKGVNTSWDTRSKVGSTAYNRFCTQFAALVTRILTTEKLPYRYVPVSNSSVWASDQDGARMADQYNAVAAWVWQQDQMPQRIHGMTMTLAKYSNIPLVMEMKKTHKRVAVVDQTSKKATFKDVTEEWPSVRVASWEALLGDYFGGDVQNQRIVAFETVVPLHVLAADSKNFDKEQWEKFKEKSIDYQWDGSTATDPAKERAENEDVEYNPNSAGRFLRRDIYAWLPIEKDEMADGVMPTLWWITTVGNEPQSSLCLRFRDDFDPDGEIPAIMWHARPDDDDKFYHVTNAQLSRCLYSVWCSLLGMLCDNVSNRNDPKRLVNTNLFREETMDNAVWKCDGPVDQAVREFIPQDTTGQLLPAIREITREWMQVMNVTENDFGRSMGAGRSTSATENLNIQEQAQMPAVFAVSYVVTQFCLWHARKVKSYVETYMRNDQVIAISDERGKMVSVRLKDLYGDFDIDVYVVGDFANNDMLARVGERFLTIIGQSPALMESKTHQVNVGELLRSVAGWLRFPNPSRFIGPAMGIDAQTRQAEEIDEMVETGQFIQPQEGEDHVEHHKVIMGEIVRWAPLKGTPEYQTVVEGLLLPHAKVHESMMGHSMASSPVGQEGGTLPAEAGFESPGEAMGQGMVAPQTGGMM